VILFTFTILFNEFSDVFVMAKAVADPEPDPCGGWGKKKKKCGC
jgi:hypothetical protein